MWIKTFEIKLILWLDSLINWLLMWWVVRLMILYFISVRRWKRIQMMRRGIHLKLFIFFRFEFVYIWNIISIIKFTRFHWWKWGLLLYVLLMILLLFMMLLLITIVTSLIIEYFVCKRSFNFCRSKVVYLILGNSR